MITVLEIWYLKPELAERAPALMQEMDDLVGPAAHAHPGWCGHARFYQRRLPHHGEVVMLYPWRSRELHEELQAREEPVLVAFTEKYCAAPRTIEYLDEIPVEVEHDHH